MIDGCKRAFGRVSLTFVFLGASIPNFASAATVVGVLIGGGGIDDMRVEVRDAKGKVVTAYCLEKCGDIFALPDADDVVNIKARYLKRKVKLDYYTEMNKGRIAGPGEERLEFVKTLEVLR